MPRLSVYFVRASLIYLLLAFTLGGLMLANKGMTVSPLIWSLLPLHMEFAFVGWMIQLALGIAFWILPRHRHGPPRGEERWSWLALILLNAGILLVILGPFLHLSWPSLFGRTAEVLSLSSFALGNWKRIRPFDV
jgi:hypothetical protein